MSIQRAIRFKNHGKRSRQIRNVQKNIYFTEKAKTSSDTDSKTDTGTASKSQDKIHDANRDHDDDKSRRTKAWTFLDSLADSYRTNKVYFVTGFCMAVFMCIIAMVNDPADRYGAYEYIREIEERPNREIDKPYGYERALKRDRELNPDLYKEA